MRHKNRSFFIKTKGGICSVLLLVSILVPSQSFAEQVTFNDTNGHWAGTYIAWAVDGKLANGYGDGSFKPNKLVNEAEFLAMLLRTYDLPALSSSDVSDWSKPYYDYAKSLGWPIASSSGNVEFRRGQVAVLLASAVNGKPYSELNAIQWLLDEKISSGRTSATVKGFVPEGKLTRAEALTFFYNLKLHTKSLSESKITIAGDSLNTIMLNDTVQKLQQKLGKPSRVDPSEYGFTWQVYNNSYTHYMMFGVQNDRVVALFSNSADSWTLKSGIQLGQTIVTAKKLAGNVSNAITKNDYYAYTSKNTHTTLFIDSHEGNKIAGLMQMDLAVYNSKLVKPANPSQLGAALEQQLFDLTNAERAVRDISLLKWDKLAAASANGHSSDMSVRQFFNHTNPDGYSPFDRMKAKGVKYHSAAENIAAGYPNSIFAHYGWLNSNEGHREALLNKKLERLGTGVAIGGSYNIYYTQNFYTP